MKQYLKNNGDGAGRFLEQLAAEKKKTVIALCLIAVMVFMWVKVLGNKTQKTAGAMPQNEEIGSSQPAPETKISFVELPKVSGRNDVLSRDFFDANGLKDSIRNNEGKSSTGVEVTGGSGEEVIRRVAGKLKLDAIGFGKNPQAFINDKVLSVGDKLLVKDEVNIYECEVVEIKENTVSIKCGGEKIKLKLTQAAEVAELSGN